MKTSFLKYMIRTIIQEISIINVFKPANNTETQPTMTDKKK